jgi:hypothetical protein
VPELHDSTDRSGDISTGELNDLFLDAVRQVLEKRRAISIEFSCKLANRESDYEARLVPSRQNQVIAVVRNVTERRRSEMLITEESRILKMIAGGSSLQEVLTGLARLNESVFPGVLCSVLLMDGDGYRLRHVARRPISSGGSS